LRFSIYQESRRGGRRVNQDRMGYLYTRDSLLLLVADGMGGHARGEVAAQLTLQTMAAI
jgi:PPM family protein phosphatase